MKSWREVAVPHTDVLEGTLLQAEFAADITAVHTGRASEEYQDPKAFFQRTFITEGMRLLISSVASRLNGKGGEPVIQLQTAFGGGKTHTMLAVYHLAARNCPLKELSGIPALMDQIGLMDIPRATVAVIDGTALAPSQPRIHGSIQTRTLWGELAWQLGKDEGYALVEESDRKGTSPGKDILQKLLSSVSPCVILIDELVAYIRQFDEGKTYPGGTYDSNISFIQALTEAVKLVPNAVLLASLPQSEVEAGSSRGVAVLRALEKTFGRLQALWKPVATEEAFEIVRRRLFDSIKDIASRDEVCRAFAEMYRAEGQRLPGETQEARYLTRLQQAYPIHPEVFDRLFEDWTTIDGFQRTRGVLKLMAKVIYRLWKDDNKDFFIMPGSIPLYDGSSRNEFTYYLQPGWDAVIERDIDGERSETAGLEIREPRFGTVNAAKRASRTLFLGSAPAAGGNKTGIRGLDRARILLGCLQPGQNSAIYFDVIGRLTDRLHYLNASGDKNQDSTRFWFDTRANLRREMEDRKSRFDDKKEVKDKIAQVLKKNLPSGDLYDGVHIFTEHADVPDDTALRLVVMPPMKFFSNQEKQIAEESVTEFIKSNGMKPRHHANRLHFLAADYASLSRLYDSARTVLAWESIVSDVKEGRLNIDRLQETQAKTELSTADEVLPRAIRDSYKWLLSPIQFSATDREIAIEEYSIPTGGASFIQSIEQVCRENELVIKVWSPEHLSTRLRELYWKSDRTAVLAMSFWTDSTKYLYLPRLRTQGVLEQTISHGAGCKDYFGIAYGQLDGAFKGFSFGNARVQLDDTLLLIEPQIAARYQEELLRKEEEERKKKDNQVTGTGGKDGTGSGSNGGNGGQGTTGKDPRRGDETGNQEKKATAFHGSVEISPSSNKVRLQEISDEILKLLLDAPNGELKITLEISAEFPSGAPCVKIDFAWR